MLEGGEINVSLKKTTCNPGKPDESPTRTNKIALTLLYFGCSKVGSKLAMNAIKQSVSIQIV